MPQAPRRGPYAKTAERRRQILDAALQVFTAHGYRAGSMREVARVADTGLSTLTHHFRTKQDLLLALLERRDADSPGQRSGTDDLVADVLSQARWNQTVPGLIALYTVLSAESVTDAHPGRDYFTERFTTVRRGFREEFEKLRDAGRLRPGVDPQLAAGSITALWDGIQLQWLLQPDEIDVVVYLQAFFDFVTQPAGGADSAPSSAEPRPTISGPPPPSSRPSRSHPRGRGNGTTGGGIGEGQIVVGAGMYAEDGTWTYPTRAASQVTGWVICCDCCTGNSFQPTTWTGPVFTRVSSPDQEDLAGRRLYAPDDEVAYVAERIDVEETVIALWRHEHVVGAETLAEIETGAIDAARARDRLDAAVATARRAGASWSDIGRAAGMNGYSAQERWRGLDGPSQ